MSNVIQLRPGPAKLTPLKVSAQRLSAGQVGPLDAWISRDRLAVMVRALEALLEMADAARSLPDEAQDQIAALGGLDAESVFDLSFAAHFELAAAEEMLGLLKQIEESGKS